MGTLHILPLSTYDGIIKKRSAKLDSVFGVDWILISTTEGAFREERSGFTKQPDTKLKLWRARTVPYCPAPMTLGLKLAR